MGFLDRLMGRGAPAASPVHVTDGNFEQEVMGHKGPLILDVWGPGCAPCQRLEPIIVSLARENAGRVKVCELNAAESPRTASRLGVRGTPTVVVFRGRAELGRVVGWRPKSYFDQMIAKEFPEDPTGGHTP
ncbi:MAG: thioredoxin fold domain-containing protein [Deltaproteobacteria bacterium]|nr:thioredoxin fold domain-containing protein [Deltaproteobacteria bacterium]